MPRHPKQNAALARCYEKRKDDTRVAFNDALDRLLRGEPIYTNGKLTESNLCREAKRSRATLNRNADIKRTFNEARRNRHNTAPTNLAEKVRELEDTIRQSRREDNQIIRGLKESRDRLAQETFILSRVIELLRREKSELELSLQEALRGVSLHIVAAKDG